MSIHFTPEDIRYIEAHFIEFGVLCRSYGRDFASVLGWVEGGSLPQPSYTLPDGRRMVSRNYFDLPDPAGNAETLRRFFIDRHAAAARELCLAVAEEHPRESFEAYMQGVYGICLREPSPENIARKEWLIRLIEDFLEHPHPQDSGWCTRLRLHVDALDRLEMPFCDYDRRFFGRPLSRDRLISAVRIQYPKAFQERDAAFAQAGRDRLAVQP